LQIAAFCIASVASGFAFLSWWLASQSVREQVWQFYGWFTALVFCGSCVGCAAFATFMTFSNLGFQFRIQVQALGYVAVLESELGRVFLLLYKSFFFQVVYNILYPIELAFMSLAKLFVLDRMVTLAKFKQNPALQQRFSVASRVVVALVVCINIVSIAGGIVNAAHIQPILNLIASGIADYNANPGVQTALRILGQDLPQSQPLFQKFFIFSNVQFICEAVLLALLVAVFTVTGIVCIRRILGLVIAPADTQLEENRQSMLRQILGTVLVIFVSFLLRITFSILQVTARYWTATHLTSAEITAFLLPGLPGGQLPPTNNCVALLSFYAVVPEFQVVIILLSSPVALVVALWGMTTLRARSLLFPFFFRVKEGRENTGMSAPLAAPAV